MGLRPLPDILDSCQVCLNFFNIAYNSVSLGPGHTACKSNQRRRIKESKGKEGQGCRLCGKIFKFLEQHYGPERGDQHAEDKKFEVILYRSEFDSDQRRAENGYSTPGSSSESVRMCEPSRDLVNWPPILSNSPAEISDYVRKLLTNCLDHHPSCVEEGETCRKEGLQEVVELPSRDLSIENNAGKISVKLLETHGLRGTYCALSHCWGPIEKPPLQTTRETFTDHLSSIPLDTLPETFQDAVVLAKDLGIQYLWIDSLCIIQRNEDDWKMEAKKMASIYQNAILVIAAAASKDSSGGLLSADRPEPLVFHCPISSWQGMMNNCHVVAAIGSRQGIRDPLRETAWVFQEWYLGRRIIFFTSQGLRWKCKEYQLDERGSRIDLELHEAKSWIHCLRGYSGKKLTYEKDRIVALLGIVADLKKSRNDSFRENLGVWDDQLAEQLLWRQLEWPRERDGPFEQDGPPLPSWCWANTVGKKGWLFMWPSRHRFTTALYGTPQTIRLTQSVSLIASGHLLRVATEQSRLDQCCLEYLDKASHVDEGAMMHDNHKYPKSDNMARYSLLDVDGDSILGLAIFDNGLHFSTCYCFILGSTKGRPSPRKVYRGNTELFPCHDICRNYMFERPPEDCRKHYWALLLQPVHGKYKRVGIAMLWQEVMERMGSEIVNFEIV